MDSRIQIIITACHVGSLVNGGVFLLGSLAAKMKTTVYGNQSWSLNSDSMFGGILGVIPYYQTVMWDDGEYKKENDRMHLD
ncbi:hypothetical protein QNI16_19715 [Cytophagaceae bacterium YF14B1]|uniref:Uncharacterized protein n=1 Tax=Xanthocytophaga flava TaxID=3048013 RepID=A0AAE3QNT3_9BACT|nr:hypothetical protein [Xanthocytophaga flavus]MDJ1482737.1 hypothetical protein [Xanthocytophaga flavus]